MAKQVVWLEPKDAAEALGVTERTLRNWKQAGKVETRGGSRGRGNKTLFKVER